jgi:hypothetical protein
MTNVKCSSTSEKHIFQHSTAVYHVMAEREEDKTDRSKEEWAVPSPNRTKHEKKIEYAIFYLFPRQKNLEKRFFLRSATSQG